MMQQNLKQWMKFGNATSYGSTGVLLLALMLGGLLSSSCTKNDSSNVVPPPAAQPTPTPAPKPEPSPTPEPKPPVITQLRVMSYNVYNLFDSEHDVDLRTKREGRSAPIEKHKDDSEFLPTEACVALAELKKAECSGFELESCQQQQDRLKQDCLSLNRKNNWTAQKYETKLLSIKKLFDLKMKDSQEASYPDIVGLVEIENEKVTQRLATMLGYAHQITTDSYDFRGIDVALMYKDLPDLKKIGHKIYEIDEVEINGTVKGKKHKRPTRPILEVQFTFKGLPLFIYVNHWPSLSNDPNNRMFAAQRLRSIIEERKRSFGKAHFLALGDFNTNEKQPDQMCENPEEQVPNCARLTPHPINDILTTSKMPKMSSVAQTAVAKDVPVAPGTYYYNNNWQDLDHMFVSENLLEGSALKIKLSTFQIFNHLEISERCNVLFCHTGEMVPRRYNFLIHPEETQDLGFSDHYPIYVTLEHKSE